MSHADNLALIDQKLALLTATPAMAALRTVDIDLRASAVANAAMQVVAAAFTAIHALADLRADEAAVHLLAILLRIRALDALDPTATLFGLAEGDFPLTQPDQVRPATPAGAH